MRYERNKPLIDEPTQNKMESLTIGIVGIGALGGYLAQGALRMGFKKLIIIDDDVFQESNLNRQLLATENTLGESKVYVAKRMLEEIDSTAKITAHQKRIKKVDDALLLQEADIILDGLDNIESRKVLQKIAIHLHVPLIHGAIGNWDGQVAFLTPDKNRMEKIYPDGEEVQKVANLVVMPMLISARQLALLVQFLMEEGNVEKNVLRRINVQEHYEVAVDLE